MSGAKKDSKEDRALQRRIKKRALLSLAIRGQTFARHGSGRALWLGKRRDLPRAQRLLREALK